MLNKHIVKAIADMAIFLEFSPENIVDPDASIEAMEQLAAELQKAPNIVQAELAQCLRDVSHEYGARSGFIVDLPESLGLVYAP
jgi:hypothetical protein